jgi:cytochrome P450
MNEHVQANKPAPLFNPLSPEFIRDPYPFYAQLRDNDPVHVTPFGAFLASRHAESSLVIRDKRFGKDFVARSIRRYGPDIMNEPVFQSMSHWMLQQDPPDHTRLRGLVVKAFTARRVEDMRPRIQEIVDRTLDEVIPQGRMDLIEDFAFKLPVTVICDMLGIPEEHREAFYKSSREGGRLLEPVPLSKAEIAEGNAGNAVSKAYFQHLFELRRKQPGDDLTTQLLQARSI